MSSDASSSPTVPTPPELPPLPSGSPEKPGDDVTAAAAAEAEVDLMDITALVEECAASLSLKEPFLRNPDTFSLHDTMAATQLMDRKMDCCEIPVTYYIGSPEQPDDEKAEAETEKELETTASEAETSDAGASDCGTSVSKSDSESIVDVEEDIKTVFPRPPPKGLGDPFTSLPWEELTVRDSGIIGLEILVRLQASLSGSSVGESTFTCLYAHCPVLHDMKRRLLGDQLLADDFKIIGTNAEKDDTKYAQFVVFASALALVEATDVTRGIIMNADIYEEEDFAPGTHDIPFFTDEVEASTLRVLEHAMRLTKDRTHPDKHDIELIMLVLSYLFGFISICTALGKVTTKSLRSEVEDMQAISQMAAHRLGMIEHHIKRLDLENDSNISIFLRKCFDSFVNRPLVGNAPVRKPFFQPMRKAIEMLERITTELNWAVCELVLRGNNLARIQRMMERVQRSDVNILSRSLILLNLYFEEKLLGQYYLKILITEHMRQLTHVPDNFVSDERVSAFFGRLAKPIYDTLKLKTLNRSRQRIYIESVMLAEWRVLQDEAHVVDVTWRREHNLDNQTATYFSQYVMSHLIRIMDRHLTVGIELGIFQSFHDLSVAFWYRDFLLSGLLNNLSMMRRAKTLVAQAKQEAEKGKNKKKNSKNKQKENAKQLQQKAYDKEEEFEMVMLGLKRDMCRGTKRFIAALFQAKVIERKNYEFTSPQRVFEERFGILTLIRQPPPLTYDDYVEGSDFSNVPQEELLDSITDSFDASKRTFELLSQNLEEIEPIYAAAEAGDLRSLIKICVGNKVYLQKLRMQITISGPEVAGHLKPLAEFEEKHEFCTIKLM